MRFLGGFGCVCLLAAMIMLVGCGDRAPLSLMEDGEAALREGQPAKALALFKKAARKTTDSAELYNNLGNAALQMGDMKLALDSFDSALNLDNKNVIAQEGRATVASYKSEWPLMQTLYNQAFYANAGNETAQARILTAWALADNLRGDERLARARLLRARQVAPAYAPALYNLAVLYSDKFGMYEDALDLFEMFVRISDKNVPAYEKAKKSIDRLRSTVTRREQPSKQLVALLDQAKQAERAGKFKDSAEIYKNYITAAPFNREVVLNGAKAAYSARQYQLATEFLSRLLAVQPKHAIGAELMARVCYDEGRYPEARLYGELYLNLLPDGDAKNKYAAWLRNVPAFE